MKSNWQDKEEAAGAWIVFWLGFAAVLVGFAVAEAFCGCSSIPVTYSSVCLIDHLNGLDHVFKVVVDHGIVEEVPRDWVRGPEWYYGPPQKVKP